MREPAYKVTIAIRAMIDNVRTILKFERMIEAAELERNTMNGMMRKLAI